MIKNASNLYPFALQDQLSNGLTGQTPSVFLRQDNGSFAAASGSVTEVDSTNYPGLYQITLTAAECNCDVLTIAVSLPDGQEPAILDVVYPVTTGGATPAEIWQYAGGRTVTNTIPTASDNAQAVWGAQTKEVTIATAQADTFATASALTSVGNNVSAVKAKTDNLPQSPAAVGSAMTLTSDYNAAKTASQFNASTDSVNVASASVTAIQSGLSTFNASTDTVTINSTQAATLATAAALATVGDNVTAIKAKTDTIPQNPAAVGDAMTLTSETVTGIKNGLSTFDPSVSTVTINSTQAATFATAASITPILALLETLYSGMFHWEVQNNELTIYDADGLAISAYTLTKDAIGNIIAVTPED